MYLWFNLSKMHLICNGHLGAMFSVIVGGNRTVLNHTYINVLWTWLMETMHLLCCVSWHCVTFFTWRFPWLGYLRQSVYCKWQMHSNTVLSHVVFCIKPCINHIQNSKKGRSVSRPVISTFHIILPPNLHFPHPDTPPPPPIKNTFIIWLYQNKE